MANLVDVFNSDAFGMLSLTDKVNHMDYTPGTIRNLGLFESVGIDTRTVQIDEDRDSLSLISSSPYGGVMDPVAVKSRATAVNVTVPHFNTTRRVYASEVASRRMLGSDQLMSIDSKVEDTLRRAARNMDATEEYLMLTALKGIILDGDMSSTLLSLFTAFNVSQQTEVDFDLDNATPASGALAKLCRQVQRTIATALGDQMYNGIHALCGAAFFDGLVAHPEVRAAYDRPVDGAYLRQDHTYNSIEYAGITFQEYRGAVGGTAFVHTDKCHVFPRGVGDLYRLYYAPADTFSAINTIGLPRYSSSVLDPSGDRFIDLNVQMNVIPLVTKPRVLVQGKRT
jgi:hypothetical protein